MQLIGKEKGTLCTYIHTSYPSTFKRLIVCQEVSRINLFPYSIPHILPLRFIPRIYIQGVQEKLCFSQFTATPLSPTCKRPSMLSMQCNCTVILMAGIFVQPIAAECWRGRRSKLSRILEKKQYLMNNL